MTHKVLYVLIIPESSQIRKSKSESRNTSQQGVVSGGIGESSTLSSQPGDQTLVGWYRGNHADEMAQEFEELFSAQDIDAVPFRGKGDTIEDRGYYTLQDVTVEPLDPRDDKAQRFDGRLTKRGTRRSHWRALFTSFDQVENDFGNDTTGYVGVPAAARKIRWFDRETLAREDASLVTTRTAELGDVEIYDAQASSFSSPTLIYDVPYNEEGRIDTKVWDDNENDDKIYSASTNRGFDDVVQWQRVFDLRHEFDGDPLVENGLVRLDFDDEDEDYLTYERFNQNDEEWQYYGRPGGEPWDWQLFDFDLTYISMARVEAQSEFYNPDTGNYFSLDMVLNRGSFNPRWIVPPNESGPVPDSLVDHLDPVAHPSLADPQEEKGLIQRNEVRK